MKDYFCDLFRGAVSLLVGLSVTLRALVSPVVTEPYPRRAAELSPRFRGSLMLARTQGGGLLCTACGVCARTCPSACLTVQGEKPQDGGRRRLSAFGYDISRCSFCGLCVDACPATALVFEPVRTRVAGVRKDFYLELFSDLERPSGPSPENQDL